MTVQDMTIQDSISQQALVSVVGQVISGYPNPDDPEQSGPWWIIIRRVMQQVLWRLGPQPDPWLSIGPGPQPWVQVALNPQPLPPRTLLFAAIAQEVIERAFLIQETADALRSQGERQSIIIIGGYVSRFVDDCGTGLGLRWPLRGPRPHWYPEEPGGADLIVTGVQFERAASESYDGQLRQVFADAGSKLTQMGLARLQ